MQQSASVAKGLIPKGHFASRVATEMLITGLSLCWRT